GGRRGSNPRPTAWKAVTLPLSYSRLRASRFGGQVRQRLDTHWLTSPRLAQRAKAGGEGRVRTSVATRAADLQSAAIDRSATSPDPKAASSQLSAASRITTCARFEAHS